MKGGVVGLGVQPWERPEVLSARVVSRARRGRLEAWVGKKAERRVKVARRSAMVVVVVMVVVVDARALAEMLNYDSNQVNAIRKTERNRAKDRTKKNRYTNLRVATRQ